MMMMMRMMIPENSCEVLVKPVRHEIPNNSSEYETSGKNILKCPIRSVDS